METKVEDETYIYLYSRIKQDLIQKGYSNEIDWISNLPKLENINKIDFFKEYVWVVLNSGMKNQVATNIFRAFWIDDTHFNFEAIKHPHKNKSIKQVYGRLEFYFKHLLQSKNILKFLENLPHIAKVTKYHLARNLGIDVAKPDRHLVRIANFFNYDNIQEFCKKISELTKDKIGVVDLVFWRFANLTEDYLEVIENWIKEVIEILDEINNTYEKVKRDENMMVIHPLNKETVFLGDVKLEGKEITGVIFKKDGTTLILYEKI